MFTSRILRAWPMFGQSTKFYHICAKRLISNRLDIRQFLCQNKGFPVRKLPSAFSIAGQHRYCASNFSQGGNDIKRPSQMAPTFEQEYGSAKELFVLTEKDMYLGKN